MRKVIDDYAARKTAEYIGLNLTGTVGVLIKARKNGYIDSVMSIVQTMEQNGIYYSEQLKKQIQKLAGELKIHGNISKTIILIYMRCGRQTEITGITEADKF